MKKLISITLAAILLLSITLQAFAVEIKDFDPPLWSQYGYSSFEEMLADYQMTAEEYYEFVGEQLELAERDSWTDEEWDEYFKQQLDSEKRSLGLLYDVNIMRNNTPFTFSDATPEIVNGRVMVPLRAMMENFGADVSYDGTTKTTVIKSGEKTLTFVTGGQSISVSEAGNKYDIRPDCAPYMKDDRVYVPARFIADALGYDIVWSSYYNTAVLFSKDEIIDELNKNFSVVNKVLAMGSDIDPKDTYKGNMSLNLKVTSLDSIKGDKVYSGGIKAAVLQNGTSMKMTLNLDLAALVDLVEQFGDGIYTEDADRELLLQILKTASNDATEIIIDLDSGMMYIRSELIPLMLDDIGAANISGDTWIEIDMGTDGLDLGLDEYLNLMDQNNNTTLGELLYNQYTTGFYDAVYAYDYMMNDNELSLIYGDDKFLKSGSGYAYDYENEEDYGDAGQTTTNAHASLVVNGDKLSRIYGYVESNTDSYIMASSTRFDFSCSATEAKLSGKYHLKNTFIVEFSFTSSNVKSTATVPTAPPPADKVITFEQLETMAS